MADTWDQYYKAVDAIREPVREFMQALASGLGAKAEEEPHSDDWGFGFEFYANGVMHYASLELWDASDYGDAEAGEQGNIHLSVIKNGGQIVRAWSPHNYTDQCWVPYTDTEELVNRVPSAEEGEELAESILAEAEAEAEA